MPRDQNLGGFFNQADIEELLETIGEFVDFINVKAKIEVCRDPKDNFLLSLSQDGKVDFLITGDQDLLELKNFGSPRILTISDFLNLE